jgi:hypothetical protein
MSRFVFFRQDADIAPNVSSSPTGRDEQRRVFPSPPLPHSLSIQTSAISRQTQPHSAPSIYHRPPLAPTHRPYPYHFLAA